MMAVTVAVWPGGDKSRAREIATLAFANVSQLAEDSQYLVVTGEGDDMDELRFALHSGEHDAIIGHARSEGALVLLRKALEELT
jgi:hypothetical protein